MKKVWKLALVFVLAVCFIWPTPVRKGEITNVTKADDSTLTAKAEIWAAENTEKILLDRSYSQEEKNVKTVRIESAKNEYENAQFIITAKQDIADVQVIPDDFKSSSGAVISAENVTVYFQKYLEINGMSSPDAPANPGMWPDALVPLSAIREKDEDRIAVGSNQGIWLTLYVPKDADAGEYTSQFTVILDGAEGKVDLSLKVYDFALPDENHVKSSFWMTKEWLMAGELDNSDEMMEQYYDQLLEYRMSPLSLPVFTYEVDDWIESLKKYTANPAVSAINLYMEYEARTVSYDGQTKYLQDYNFEVFRETLRKMAEQSTPELNLFSKIYFNDNSIDEPEGTDRIFDANYKQEVFDQTLADFVEELKSENFDFEAHGLSEADILGIEFVVTNRYMETLPDLRNYCPLMNEFATEEQRDKYKKLRESKEYGSTWWYIAWNPQYPYANYRIEESSVGSRVISWMQKDYGINGFLYWCTNVYCRIDENITSQPRDPYDDPYSMATIPVTCDGQLTYPGRPYGIYGFVPSIRLQSIRDGMEDYEYLYLLEQLIAEANESYSADLDFEKLMDSIYALLYDGVIPNADGDNLRQARREVADMIELLASDLSAITLVGAPDTATNTATIEIYATDVDTLTINGSVVAPEVDLGNGRHKYLYTCRLTDMQNYAEIVFASGEKTYSLTKYVGQKTNAVALFEDGVSTLIASNGHSLDPREHITLSADSTRLKVAIAEYDTDNPVALALYSPSVSLLRESIGDISLTEMDSFSFVIENTTGATRELKIALYAGSSEKIIQTVSLKPGENLITVKNISLLGWSNLGKADRISLLFERVGEDDVDVYYIGNMYYTAV